MEKSRPHIHNFYVLQCKEHDPYTLLTVEDYSWFHLLEKYCNCPNDRGLVCTCPDCLDLWGFGS